MLCSQGKVTSISLHLEISSVLFNTAVLFMTHGSNAYKEGSGGSEVRLGVPGSSGHQFKRIRGGRRERDKKTAVRHKLRQRNAWAVVVDLI